MESEIYIGVNKQTVGIHHLTARNIMLAIY